MTSPESEASETSNIAPSEKCSAALQCIVDLFANGSHISEMGSLLALGFTLGLSPEIEIARYILFRHELPDFEGAKVLERGRIKLKDIHADLLDGILNASGNLAVRGEILGRLIPSLVMDDRGESLASVLTREEVGPLPKEAWLPAFVPNGRIVVHMPELYGDTECAIILEGTNCSLPASDPLVSRVFSLMSAFRVAIAVGYKQSEWGGIYDSLKRKLEYITNYDLIDVVPLVLGKAHDTQVLLGRQKQLVHTLRHTRWAKSSEGAHSKLVQAIEETTDRLQQLHTSMRTFTRLEAPKFAKEDMVSLVETSLYPFRMLFDELKIHVRVSFQSRRLLAECDSTLMKEVVTNIIDNARKQLSYQKHRVRSLDIRLTQTDRGIVLILRDNGGGISPEYVPHIFDRYFSTRPGGTGLGLYYAKKIVEDIHYGTLEVISKWGNGTEFKITLPSIVKGRNR